MTTMTSDYSGQALQRLRAALESTQTGIGLLNGVVVLSISETARADVVGVPRGAINVYRSGATRKLQIFDDEGTGAPGWFDL